MNILFVCTGNICRSPIAERMLAVAARDADISINVLSAGTRALNGLAMHRESARVLRGYGINPEDFASQLLTPSLVNGADLVLGLAREHRAVARQLVPIRWKRMHALNEFAQQIDRSPADRIDLRSPLTAVSTDDEFDIEDPINRPAEVFDRVGAQIAQTIPILVQWLSGTDRGRHGTADKQGENAPL